MNAKDKIKLIATAHAAGMLFIFIPAMTLLFIYFMMQVL